MRQTGARMPWREGERAGSRPSSPCHYVYQTPHISSPSLPSPPTKKKSFPRSSSRMATLPPNHTRRSPFWCISFVSGCPPALLPHRFANPLLRPIVACHIIGPHKELKPATCVALNETHSAVFPWILHCIDIQLCIASASATPTKLLSVFKPLPQLPLPPLLTPRIAPTQSRTIACGARRPTVNHTRRTGRSTPKYHFCVCCCCTRALSSPPPMRLDI